MGKFEEMDEITTFGTFLVAAIASLFMAWSIGAGSSGSTPFAPAVGANAISVMRAGFLVGILGFSGAVLQGANISKSISKGLISGVTLSPSAVTIVLIIAGTLVAIGIFTGYPIATAFTTTGAVIGVGLAMGGDPMWPKYLEIAAMWILTPFVGGGLAYAIARALRGHQSREKYVLVSLSAVVGAIISNIEFAVLGTQNGGASISITVAELVPFSKTLGAAVGTLGMIGFCAGLTAVGFQNNPGRTQRRFLLGMGALVAFSAGGSQVGLAIGPLIPLSSSLGIPLFALLIGGGFGLLVGSWTGAPRMIKAIAQDYSSLGPRRSIAALIPSFAIAQTAVILGIPISFNETIISSIIGAGYATSETGSSNVSRNKIVYTIFAWVLSFSCSFTISYLIFHLLSEYVL